MISIPEVCRVIPVIDDGHHLDSCMLRIPINYSVIVDITGLPRREY